MWLAAVILLLVASTGSSDLALGLSRAKLQMRNSLMVTIYDGKNSIYIFGGQNSTDTSNRILQYKIKQDTISEVSYFQMGDYSGVGAINVDGQLFLIGGEGRNSTLYVFDPITNQAKLIGNFHRAVVNSAIVKKDVGEKGVFVIGGQGYEDDISYLNLNLPLNSRSVGTLPVGFRSITAVSVKKSAFVFGFSPNIIDAFLKVDLQDFRAKVVPTSMPTSMPKFKNGSTPSAIFDGGSNIYIIGGYESKSGFPTNGIIQINTETLESAFLPIEQFMVAGSDYLLFSPSTVFIEKLNRIYLFGGCIQNEVTNKYKFYDDIWFLDLPPSDGKPTTGTPIYTVTSSTPEINKQVFHLWTNSNDNCTGTPDWTLHVNSNLSATLDDATFHYNGVGLWTYRVWVDENTWEVSVGYSYNTDECTKIDVSIIEFNRLEIIRHGDPYQSSARIHFFTKNYFRGDEHIVEQDGIEQVDVTAKSWFFSGVLSWRVYDVDQNYQCFIPSESVVAAGFGMTFNYSTSIRVDSVYLDCFSGSTQLKTKSTTISTSKKSTSKATSEGVVTSASDTTTSNTSLSDETTTSPKKSKENGSKRIIYTTVPFAIIIVSGSVFSFAYYRCIKKFNANDKNNEAPENEVSPRKYYQNCKFGMLTPSSIKASNQRNHREHSLFRNAVVNGRKSDQPCHSIIQVGEGAFGKVYKVEDSSQLGIYYAIKQIALLKALKRMGTWDVQKIFREVKNLQEIDNVNVIKLHDFWAEDNVGKKMNEVELMNLVFYEWSSTVADHFLYLKLEFCDSTLEDWLKSHPNLECRENNEIKRIMSQVVNGLKGIHEKGIIHRDLKPNNIFYQESTNLWKIGNLGLSTKVVSADMTVIGCAPYRSPEMALEEYDTRTDVFSLGLTFLQLIHTFSNNAVRDRIFNRIRAGEEVEIATQFSATSEIIIKMLAVDPNLRIGSSDQLFADLLATEIEQ